MSKRFVADPVSMKNVKIHDSFFSNIMSTAAEKLIPYQWAALNDQVEDADPSYCIRNFKAAAGLIDAPHGGRIFQDSDAAKWIEAAAYTLVWKPDPKLEQNIDETIDLIAAAQQEDGYLDTAFILERRDERWTNLRDWHELYCA
ncbi:MAG: glycoside hydrolase family 127 protein, partial [Oscillospiraceae bacterium]|nr:glycoside hydrolase family 127 protein [Oscillospiraceae bacterium]